jgi:ABC-type uncharacterized transport system ATPase subunit
MNNILRTRNLHKEFDGLVATDGLNYELERGELECIIGPNGAGKTTFFDLITGSLAPNRGTVEFDGEDITGLPIHEIARKGMVRKYQTPAVYGEISVRRNIGIALGKNGPENPDERTDEILDRIELLSVQHQSAGSLDHGRKQWLEIGMVLANDPQLVLLDEPTAGMTGSETSRTAELIVEIIRQEDVSIIAIEHDIDFVRQLNCLITVLHQGKVLTTGSIDDIERNESVQEVYLGR